MEIVTRNDIINGIPVLACCRGDASGPMPLILAAHGFQGAKENFQDNLQALAERGFYATALDNVAHGERLDPGVMSRVCRDGKYDVLAIRRLMQQTADEIPALIDRLLAGGRVDAGRIGMFGVSMGGYITFRALVVDPRIKAAAPIIASPCWDELPQEGQFLAGPDVERELAEFARRYAPAAFPDRFYPRAVLAQIGGHDPHFNGERVKDFFKELEGRYGAEKSRLKLIVHESVGHEFTETMWRNVMEWFEQYV
jgi:dienelactone hydrolase